MWTRCLRHGHISNLSVLLMTLLTFTSAARVTNPSKIPKNAVLLPKISSLTLRAGKSTSSRRVASVPQLKCVGPSSVCSLYHVDIMRCKNEGADYDDNDIQWTCTASLPEEFKLGGTDVSCEGYESSEDPYILKGSCGVEYRLLLTQKGEAKYGKSSDDDFWSSFKPKSGWEKLADVAFWLIFGAVLVGIVLSAFGCLGGRDVGGHGGHRPGWGGGGGGDDDSPPPYSDPPPPGKYTQSTRSAGNNRAGGAEPWRPGFWTGAGAGAAAGYLMGNRGRNQPTNARPSSTNNGGMFGGWGNDGGEGSSRSSSSPSYSSSRHQSTGFGSTSRR